MRIKRSTIFVCVGLLAVILSGIVLVAYQMFLDSPITLSPFDTTGVLLVGVLRQDCSVISDSNAFVGGVTVGIDLAELDRILDLEQEQLQMRETVFEGKKGEYEVAVVLTANEYRKEIEPNYSAQAECAFAYSYETRDVYYFSNETAYQIEMVPELMSLLGEQLSPHTKFFWHERADDRKTLNNGCTYSTNFDFRYQRYWGKKDDYYDRFTELEGYEAETFEEMLVNAAEALQLESYSLIIAYDQRTGFFRIEFYNDAVSGWSHGRDWALVYFDNCYELLWGVAYY